MQTNKIHCNWKAPARNHLVYYDFCDLIYTLYFIPLYPNLYLYSQTKYPDVVTLPEGLLGDYIILRNPKLSG